MNEIGHGHVIKYAYLWKREQLKGEESGRKTRPTCVMVIVAGADGRKSTLLFPITSQPPGSETLYVEVPDIEAHRAKLRRPAWIIVSEFNVDDPATSYALEDTKPLGRFSLRFMSHIAAAAAAAIRAGRSKAVPRK
jgi:hypothetical protein